jgi:uracil-DNA glycosylase
MKWESFKNKFHESYHEIIKPFIESVECDEIYAFLKAESGRGALIAPQSINTFRTFKETPLHELKCVLMFQDPYFVFKEGAPVADGLALGCSISKKLQPTLKQFYSGIEEELFNGLNLNWDMEQYDVSYLSQQGVLMLNASLTVRKDKAGSHKEVWKPFTEYVIKNIINKSNVPTVLFGKDAQEYEHLFTSDVLKAPHPASASYSGNRWDTKGTFKKLDKIIWEQQKETVVWLAGIPF